MPFPATKLLDSFNRNEGPLFNGGKWLVLPWATTTGECLEGPGWVANVSKSGTGGAYWLPEEFTGPALSIETRPEGKKNAYFGLWCCLEPISKSGYFLRIVAEEEEGEPGENFKFILEKWESGSNSILVEKAKIGLTLSKGKLASWYNEVVLFETSDSKYTTGSVGIEGNYGAWAGETNFRAENALLTLTKPEIQHNYIGKYVTLQIKAFNAEEYEATNLPKGLSINETTGKITGEPTTEESPKVKIKVKGNSEEAETEFEWIITIKPEGGVNVLGMILS